MNIVIIGANSAIAKAVAREYIAKNETVNFFLTGRDEKKLALTATDLKVRGAASVEAMAVDFSDNTHCHHFHDSVKAHFKHIDLLLMAHSLLGDQQACEQKPDQLMAFYQVNTLSSLYLLTLFSHDFEQQKQGTIAFIASVAADRGRPSNYVYGSSKAAVVTFLQGLNARLKKVGVQVLTIKPGFVSTPMTQDFDRSGPLWVEPDVIAKAIIKAIDKKRNTLYAPWFWQPIMMIICAIPTKLFQQLKL